MTPDDATVAILRHLAAGSPYGPAGELVADFALAPRERNLYLPSEPIPTVPDTWGTVEVLHRSRTRIGFPATSFIVRGTIYVRIYVPLGTGSQTIRSIAHDMARRLDSKQIPGAVKLAESSQHEISPDPETRFLEVRVESRFRYDDDRGK